MLWTLAIVGAASLIAAVWHAFTKRVTDMASGGSPGDNYMHHMNAGRTALENGQYAVAREEYEAALEIVEKEFGPSDDRWDAATRGLRDVNERMRR